MISASVADSPGLDALPRPAGSDVLVYDQIQRQLSAKSALGERETNHVHTCKPVSFLDIETSRPINDMRTDNSINDEESSVPRCYAVPNA